MKQFFTHPITITIGIIIIIGILAIIGYNFGGWFGGSNSYKIYQMNKKIVGHHPNIQVTPLQFFADRKISSLPQNNINISRNIKKSQCEKISLQTKELSDQLKSLLDALQHEEVGNIEVIRKFYDVREAHYDAWIKCQYGEICKGKTVTCYGF